jgi:hypothetical protein
MPMVVPMDLPMHLNRLRDAHDHRPPGPATARRSTPDPGRHRAHALIAVLAACMGLLAGCSSLGVQPWERELLARPEMQLDPAPLQSAADDHTYFSKEAASGGRSFGGGGCGCN